MEKGSLLWATPGIDITDQVIRAYDAMNVKVGSLGQEAGAGGGTGFGSAAAGGPPPSSAQSGLSGPPPGSDEEGGRSTISK
jgi:hypothetical protein